MAEGMLRAARGEVPENVVNRRSRWSDPGFPAKLARFPNPLKRFTSLLSWNENCHA